MSFCSKKLEQKLIDYEKRFLFSVLQKNGKLWFRLNLAIIHCIIQQDSDDFISGPIGVSRE